MSSKHTEHFNMNNISGTTTNNICNDSCNCKHEDRDNNINYNIKE